MKCPRCGAGSGGRYGVHSHSLSVWCLNCGWGRNWTQAERSPAVRADWLKVLDALVVEILQRK